MKEEITAIFVLGMHRSGTSALARGLASLGVHWGTDLLEKKEDNPRGFWEDKIFHGINSKILEDYTSDKNYAFSMTGQVDFSCLNHELIDNINEFLREKNEQNKLWGCKDPRCCLTFPIWKKQMANFNINDKVVMIFRNPLDVAQSLQNRDEMPIEHGLLLWYSYNFAILQNARQSIVYICSYEQLLENPRKCLREIATKLEIDVKSINGDIEEFSSKFLTKDLQHHQSSTYDISKSIPQYKEVLHFYESLLCLSLSQENLRSELEKKYEKISLFEMSGKYLSIIPNKELKHECLRANNSFYATSRLYFDAGDGYSESNLLTQPWSMKNVKDGIHFYPERSIFIEKMRFDPCLAQCIIDFYRLVIELDDGKNVTLYPSSSSALFVIGNRYFFDTISQFIFSIRETVAAIHLYFDISFNLDASWGTAIKHFNNLILETNKTVVQRQHEIDRMESVIKDKNLGIEKQRNSIVTQQRQIVSMRSKIQNLEEKILHLENTVEKQKQINSQIIASKEKDFKLLRRQLKEIPVFMIHMCRNSKSKYLITWFFRTYERVYNFIALKKNYHIIAESGLFDKDYYLRQNQDVASAKYDPIKHYLLKGWLENRKPSKDFDTSYYISKYQDILTQRINPLLHYIKYGKNEGRLPTLASEEIEIIASSWLFDENYYSTEYPDLKTNDTGSVIHYYLYGWKEGKNPSQFFNTKYYLDKYKDVERAGINPLLHYIQHGKKNKRYPSIDFEIIELIESTLFFDREYYIQNYSDCLAFPGGPAAHYYFIGWKNGANPSAIFNTNMYLSQHQELAKENINPLWHYYYYSFSKNLPIACTLPAPLFYGQYDPKKFYEDEEIQSFKTDVKLIAYHLPQFHRMPENDEWWGEGFTEWTKVKAAQPLFTDHYQPRVPHQDIGYYDLTSVDAIKRQVELAKKHGVHGFCFYYYWFAGKRLMEKPLDIILSHPEIDIPFCLCWANESWTRRWTGEEKDILIEQVYSPENDIEFIKEMAVYLMDPRYIKCEGRPMIVIYRARNLPDPKQTTHRIRSWCRENGIGEIYLLASLINDIDDAMALGFDAAIERPLYSWEMGEIVDRKSTIGTFREEHSGVIYHHEDVVDLYTKREFSKFQYTVHRGLNVMWDPSSRHEDRCHIVHRSTPAQYKRWLDNVLFDTRLESQPEKFIFINAWNEWAEGTYLEPDNAFGYAFLNATGRSLAPYKLWINSVRSGGTRLYIQRKIAEELGYNHLHLNISEKSIEINNNDCKENQKSITDLVNLLNIKDICIVSFVFNKEIYRNLKEFSLLKENLPDLQITYQFHDFYGICPSINLLDLNNVYCKVNYDIKPCLNCLPYNGNKLFLENDMHIWRSAWKEFLEHVDKVEVFSKSSSEIVKRVYPEISDKIVTNPHSIKYLDSLLVEIDLKLDSLHLGYLGEASEHKGLLILESLVPELKKRKIPLTIIGKSERLIDPYITTTGYYNPKDIPKIVEELGINIFLQLSIWPETYCYTVSELRKLGLPVICFDLGGQADLLREYRLGKILPEDLRFVPSELLDEISKFYIWVKENSRIDIISPKVENTLRYPTKVDFLIAGVQKAGTSALHTYLAMHPQLIPPATTKELQFFTRQERDIEWYYHQFPQTDYGDCYCYESTPDYTCNYKVIQDIANYKNKHSYDLKIILLFRDPVSRAFSQWNMTKNFIENVKNPKNQVGQAIKKYNRRAYDLYCSIDALPSFKECFDIFNDAFNSLGDIDDLRQLNRSQKLNDIPGQFFTRGLYIFQVKALLEFFNPEDLIILSANSLKNDPVKVLENISEFIGINAYDWPKERVGIKHHVTQNRKKLDVEVSTHINEFYTPFNEAFFDFLNRRHLLDNTNLNSINF